MKGPVMVLFPKYRGLCFDERSGDPFALLPNRRSVLRKVRFWNRAPC